MNPLLYKLKTLYEQLDRHQAAGDDVVAEVRAEINNLELSYLKDEVFPEMANMLAKKIGELKCQIDFSFVFNGENELDYTFCTSGSTLMVRDKVVTDDVPGETALNSPVSVVEDEEESPVSPVINEKASIRIEHYSKKAIVVYGDTKPYSEYFKNHGGYFNPRLRSGAGWVFSKKREEELRRYLGLSVDSYKAVLESPSKTDIDKEVQSSRPELRTSNDYNEESDVFDTIVSSIKNMRTRIDYQYGYKAPHKAILLLSILEAINYGVIKENKIYFNPALISRYEKLWKEYVPSYLRFSSNPSAPFIHLASEPFFSHSLYKPITNINQNWNPQYVRTYVRYGRLEERFFSLASKKFFDLKKILIDNFLDFPPKPQTQISATTSPITEFSEEKYPSKIGYNLIAFKKYLSTLDNAHGKRFSPSSINVYGGSLKSAYMIGKVRKFIPSGNLFEITIPNQLHQLYADVQRDTDSKLVSNSYLQALKLYIQFVRQIKKGDIVLSEPEEILSAPSSTKYKSEAARAFPLHGKLKQIITPGFTLSFGTPTQMLVEYISHLGVEQVYNLKIPYLGRYLVDTTRHPKYLGQAKYIDGYWVNTCSSTAKKIEQMSEIAKRLGIDVKFIAE